MQRLYGIQPVHRGNWITMRNTAVLLWTLVALSTTEAVRSSFNCMCAEMLNFFCWDWCFMFLVLSEGKKKPLHFIFLLFILIFALLLLRRFRWWSTLLSSLSGAVDAVLSIKCLVSFVRRDLSEWRLLCPIFDLWSAHAVFVCWWFWGETLWNR